MVKAEMGLDAMILSSKKERRRGILGYFSKPYFEVTAALEPRAAQPSQPVPRRAGTRGAGAGALHPRGVPELHAGTPGPGGAGAEGPHRGALQKGRPDGAGPVRAAGAAGAGGRAGAGAGTREPSPRRNSRRSRSSCTTRSQAKRSSTPSRSAFRRPTRSPRRPSSRTRYSSAAALAPAGAARAAGARAAAERAKFSGRRPIGTALHENSLEILG